MEDREIASAVELAREAARAGPDVVATTLVVHRMDTGAEYVLVQLGAPGEPGWVAAVDPAADDVMSWAANPSGAPTVPAATASRADYVWAPTAVSPSPLYPLLRLETPCGRQYLDIAGVLHDSLSGHRG